MGVITRRRDMDAVPFRGEQPDGMRPDLLIPDLWPADDRMWVPLDDGVWSRPLSFDVTHGSYAHLMRVTRQGIIARHRHSGTVHAMVLRGSWHYLEHDWVASEGSFALEPPGETHTLVVPDGCQEMATVFFVTGALIYVNPDGVPIGYDDVFSRLALTREHYARVGLEATLVDELVR
jgi:quercetin dioxygenase-like cupin family protein